MTKIFHDIESQIRYQRKDNLINHLRICLLMERDFAGAIKENKFVIWRYSNLSGVFYPVVHGVVSMDNGQVKCKLHAKLNAAAKMIASIIFTTWLYGIVLGAKDWSVNTPEAVATLLLLISGLVLIPVLLFRMIVRSQKRAATTETMKLIKSSSLNEQS